MTDCTATRRPNAKAHHPRPRGRSRARASLAIATLAACSPLALPAAHANSAAADYFRTRADRSAVPRLLSEDERAWYRDAFAALHRQDWARVQALLTERPEGPLHPVLRAEYYLAPSSPRIDLDVLNLWLSQGADLPEAPQIANLAVKRGATVLPPLPQPQALVSLPGSPRRSRPRDVVDGTMPAQIATAIQERIKADDPVGEKVLLDGIDSQLSPEARAEWRQKVAWSQFITGDDSGAYAQALSAAQGDPQAAYPAPITATVAGPWTGEAWWTAGLAAFRAGDCARAADAFAHAPQATANPELTAAGYYWQSRALIRCRQPEQAAVPLRAAARLDETYYGMLAAEQLGMRLPATHAAPDFTAQDWQSLRDVGNVRMAVSLAEVGEDGLADEVLRHQARIGPAELYQPLSRLARDLGLPQTQMWMATNLPAGAVANPTGRYPTPKWNPAGGWQVDPALILAHSLQESAFRTTVVSPAGARGLMQIMPGTARDNAWALGVTGSADDLTRPEINLAMGQKVLQNLRDNAATGGLLPKVIAAYNAGALPVARWNTQIRDQGDPLLWMESVPYWETRGYVATVIRNYWMYERQAGGPSESRIALAQGLWPAFPGLAGASSVRMAANTYQPAISGAGRGN